MVIGKGCVNAPLNKIIGWIDWDKVCSHFLGIDKIPSLIKSPFREDNKPSFSIYRYNRSVMYKDFATGEYGSILDLLMKLLNKPLWEVLDIIKNNENHNLNFIDKNYKSKNMLEQEVRKVDIQVRVRDFNENDIKYIWGPLGITREWLSFGDVYPISHIIFKDEETGDVAPTLAHEYAYAYLERKDGNITFKIYQPFSPMKWISSHNNSVWDLWKKIPVIGEKLIITSSRKDSLCVWANTGIPCCNMQSEIVIPKENVIQELKDRYKKIYILYDDDKTGNERSDMLSERFGLIKINISDCFKDISKNSLSGKLGKDPSEICGIVGRKRFSDIMRKYMKSYG